MMLPESLIAVLAFEPLMTEMFSLLLLQNDFGSSPQLDDCPLGSVPLNVCSVCVEREGGAI